MDLLIPICSGETFNLKISDTVAEATLFLPYSLTKKLAEINLIRHIQEIVFMHMACFYKEE